MVRNRNCMGLLMRVGVMCLTILIGAFASTAVAAPIIVDTTSDSDDGSCGLPSNDCTLREAINAVNAGIGEKIDFDPGIFPRGVLTNIILSSELPAIMVSGTTIDGSGTGVVIHGAGLDGDGIIFESGAGNVLTNVTVRSIIVRYFQGNGIYICGGIRSNGCDETISKVTVNQVTVNGNDENGIYIRGREIDKATVQHAYAEGNESTGINMRATTGDLNKPQVNDCTTVYNFSGISLRGGNIINAKLTDNTICRNTPGVGIILSADSQLIRPKLTGNTASENSRGINLSANDTMLMPNLSDNYVANNITGGIFASSSLAEFRGGQFKDNVVMENNQGIYIYGGLNSSSDVVKVKVQGNRVVNNNSIGIWIEGSNNQVKNNVVSDNGNDGIRLDGPGQGNKIQRNRVIGNQGNGIQVNSNSTNAQITGNEARGNDNYDLDDENGGCGANSWRSNIFVTSNQACIE